VKEGDELEWVEAIQLEKTVVSPYYCLN